jgi:hypothetical protein
MAKSLVNGLSAGAPVVAQEPRSVTSGPVPAIRQTQKRLDAASVDALVDGYLGGQTVYELAAEFGIERRAVSAHCTGEASRCDDVACRSRRKRKRSRCGIVAGRCSDRCLVRRVGRNGPDSPVVRQISNLTTSPRIDG